MLSSEATTGRPFSPVTSILRLCPLAGGGRYELKTPWSNGTTHVIFEPLDFISRLVALVPKSRVNLTRFHGVFAPNSKYRSRVTPAKRGKRKKCHVVNESDQTPAEKRASMTWAKRLKRVFNIDIETCDKCGGDARIIPKAQVPSSNLGAGTILRSKNQKNSLGS
jgi:hypothetical protein